MDIKGKRRSTNIEDRRGEKPPPQPNYTATDRKLDGYVFRANTGDLLDKAAGKVAEGIIKYRQVSGRRNYADGGKVKRYTKKCK